MENAGEYPQAIKNFERLYEEYPKSKYSPCAGYFLMKYYFRKEDYAECIRLCEDLLKKYPDFSMTADTRYYMGTMGQKRKKHTEEFRAKVAIEALKGVRSLSELSSAYGVHPIVIGQWKRRLIERAQEAFSRSNGKGGAEETVASLYEQIGRLKVELDWLKKSCNGSSKG